jgi:serine/threonine-protein kinase
MSVKIPGVKLLGKIGEGSQGVVLKGILIETKTPVAIKILSPRLAQVAEYRRRFAREMGVATQLDHPNIVKAIKAGKLEKSFYYIMEFASGVDVNRLLNKLGPLPEKKALYLAIQVADALNYAHKEGLVHRDIKPDNLIVSRDWKVKILDLGLAKDDSAGADLTMAGTIFGTANYISPEAIEDSKSVDARSDIFSLGATLYKMLAGRPPFEGATPTMIMEKVLHEEAPHLRSLRPEITPGCEIVVRKALAKAKEDRYASAAKFHKDLIRVYRGEEPKAAAPPAVIRKGRTKGDRASRTGPMQGKPGLFARLLGFFGLGGKGDGHNG